MYERFTDRARKVMQLANQEAQRFNHLMIAPELILLGLLKEGSGVGYNVLKNLQVYTHKLRLEVEKTLVKGKDVVTMGKLPQTLAAKKVIENATASARSLNMNYIGTEHILLGLFDDPPLLAIFSQMGVSRKMAEEELRKMLNMNETKGPFTQRTLLVLDLANSVAMNNDSQVIGSPHLLLALLKEKKGLACQVLANLDTDVKKLEETLLSIAGPTDFRCSFNLGRVPPGKDVQAILDGAVAEAKVLGMEENVGTEHLLLAMFGDPFLLKLFQEVGLRYSAVKEEILALCPLPKPPEGKVVFPSTTTECYWVGESQPDQTPTITIKSDAPKTLTYNTHKMLVTALHNEDRVDALSEKELVRIRAEFEKGGLTTSSILLPSMSYAAPTTPYTYHQKNKDGSEFTITFANDTELMAFVKEQLRGQNPESDTSSCFCM